LSLPNSRIMPRNTGLSRFKEFKMIIAINHCRIKNLHMFFVRNAQGNVTLITYWFQLKMKGLINAK